MRPSLRRLPPLLLAAALLASPAASPAAWAAPRSITVALIGEDGVPLEPFDASDTQISLSRSSEPTGMDGGTQAALSLDIGSLSNPTLLGWMGAPGEAGGALITVATPGGTMVYLLSEVTSRSLSISHMTSNMDGSVSVSLAAKHLTVNGRKVN